MGWTAFTSSNTNKYQIEASEVGQESPLKTGYKYTVVGTFIYHQGLLSKRW